MSIDSQLEQFSDLSRVIKEHSGAVLPWSEEVSRADFEAALQRIENSLALSPDCAETRLWWVRCQLEAERLPAAALAAPLEEIFDKLTSEPHLALLAATTLYKLGLLLINKGQARLGLVMFERALEIAAPSPTITPEEVQCLRNHLISSMKQEQNRATARREPKKYLDDLEIKIKTQEQAKKKPLSRSAERQELNGKKSQRLSAKSIVSEALETGPEKEQQSSTEPSDTLPEAAVPSSIEPEDNVQGSAPRRSSRLGGVWLVLLLLCIFALIFWQRTRIFGGGSLPGSIAMYLPLPEQTQLSLPSAGRFSSKGSSLANVGRRLEEMSKRKQPEEKGQFSKETSLENQPAEVMVLPKAEKEGIVSITKELGLEPNNQSSNAKIPELDAGRFRDTKVESIGSSPMKAPVPAATSSALRTDPSGRIYGPPSDGSVVPLPGDSRALDGSRLRSYEVKQFDPPLRYHTITSTEVLSAPSLLARSLDRLGPRTPIDVTAHMGLWLELRSTGGRVGYIYAQDAVEDK